MARTTLFDSIESKYVQPVKERIKQLRLNMLIHSYLYYHLDSPIISDDAWQRRADELAHLQDKHPRYIGCYDNEFKDWTGSTGYFLPVDLWVISKATYLLVLHNRRTTRPRTRVQVQTIQRRPTRKEAL